MTILYEVDERQERKAESLLEHIAFSPSSNLTNCGKDWLKLETFFASHATRHRYKESRLLFSIFEY